MEQRDEMMVEDVNTDGGAWAIGRVGAVNEYFSGEVFTPPRSFWFDRTKVLFRAHIGGAQANVRFYLYRTAAGLPTGSYLLRTREYTPAEMTAVPGGLPGWFYVYFEGRYLVSNGITYIITCETVAPSAPNNYYLWSAQNVGVGGLSTIRFGAGHPPPLPWINQPVWSTIMEVFGIFFPGQLMMRIWNNDTAAHNARLECNEYVQDLTWIFRIPRDALNAELHLDLYDSVATRFIRVRIQQVGGNWAPEYYDGAWLRSNINFNDETEWHEIRLFIHNGNSPTPNRVEMFQDGFKLWETGGVLSNVIGSELLKDIADSILSYHVLRVVNGTAANYFDVHGLVIKEWADMDTYLTNISEDCPFSQVRQFRVVPGVRVELEDLSLTVIPVYIDDIYSP